MGENTKISWCDHTFNPWWGCTKVSPACKNCYAEALAKRWGRDFAGERRITSDANWRKPIAWNKRAAERGVRERVFCGSMCDVFEDHPVAAETRGRLGDLIVATPALDWLLLTKRPEIMADPTRSWPPNAWAMSTVEDQQRANERVPHLLRVPAPVRGLSVEPMLGPVDLEQYIHGNCLDHDAAVGGSGPCWGHRINDEWLHRIHWVIIGCESGPKRRETKIEWVRDLVAQCRAAGVAVFVKQLTGSGGKLKAGSRVSTDPADWPEDLRIQEFPR